MKLKTHRERIVCGSQAGLENYEGKRGEETGRGNKEKEPQGVTFGINCRETMLTFNTLLVLYL